MNKLGFGFLRLPKLDPQDDASIDYEKLNELVDEFLRLGGRYFDTAYTYHDGMSEVAVRKSLVERHSRESFILADKLPSWKVKSKEDNWKYFNRQLEKCGVDYFDVYLLHWLNDAHYEIAERYDEFGFLQELKAKGKAKKIGFSYHDDADLLERILKAHPEVDYVQLQINYLDWESAAVQSRKCYEVAEKHGKQIIVMEPVKGGTLAKVSAEAAEVFAKLDVTASPAKWALRFVQSLPQVETVLSGMNSMSQIIENMEDMQPVSKTELQVYEEVCNIIVGQTAIPCTACGYCAGNCPKHIAIPQYFKLYNEYCGDIDEAWKIQPVYEGLTKNHGKASECIECRVCERNCPQKIEITDWLKKTAAAMEC